MAKLDKNGYADSIFDTEPGKCYICGGEGDTVRHEVFYGHKDRKMSKWKGCWLNICPSCHRIIHEKPDNGKLDRSLKRGCYHKYCELYGREVFFAHFRRYYD